MLPTREITVTNARLLPRPSPFKDFFPILHLVTCQEKFPEHYTFSYSEEELPVKAIDKNHRTSPPVPEGFKIPLQVTTEIDLTERNKAIFE